MDDIKAPTAWRRPRVNISRFFEFLKFFLFKGTVSKISSATIYAKMAMPDLQWYRRRERYVWTCMISMFCSFSFAVSLQKWLAHFLFIRRNGEIPRNKHFTSEKNDVIFHIIDQIKVSSLESGLVILAWRVT